MEEMPFFQEEYLGELPLNLDLLNNESITDFGDFKVFEQRGLHFIHLNINSIRNKFEMISFDFFI